MFLKKCLASAVWLLGAIIIYLMYMNPKYCETKNEEKQVKTILYWNSFFQWHDYKFGYGTEPFLKFNCPVPDCFITRNRSEFPIDQFDAILFHGAQYHPMKKSDFPSPRSPHQIYAYFSFECPDMFPSYKSHNGFFNLTLTYRLDSDIHMPYFGVYDSQERHIAPAVHPLWQRPNHHRNHLQQFENIFKRKSKPIAWFVSKCSSPNDRMSYVRELQKYIEVDIYGKCGPLKCPHNKEKHCVEKLRNDYFFYLAFENSMCIDYVSERMYFSLRNEVVPVALGGADLLKNVPPYSVINAREFSPQQLAEQLKFLMNNSEEYTKYLWWMNDYHLRFGSEIHPFCSLCERLHSKEKKYKTYDRFYEWFHGSEGNPMCTKQLTYNEDWRKTSN